MSVRSTIDRHEFDAVDGVKMQQCRLAQCANACVEPAILSACNNDRIASSLFNEWMRSILRQQHLHVHLNGSSTTAAALSPRCDWAMSTAHVLAATNSAGTTSATFGALFAMLVATLITYIQSTLH